MTRERLNKLYFDWIYEKVIDGHKSYRELLCIFILYRLSI